MDTRHQVSAAGDPPRVTDDADRWVTGPAVAFDPAALRSWLAQPAPCDDGDRASQLGVDDYFGRAHGTLLAGLDDLLAALADDPAQTVWLLAGGVNHVGYFRTFDGDGCDGAIIVADLDNGVRLASLHHDHNQFAGRDSHGIDAAIEALASLAHTANHIVGQYRMGASVSQDRSTHRV